MCRTEYIFYNIYAVCHNQDIMSFLHNCTVNIQRCSDLTSLRVSLFSLRHRLHQNLILILTAIRLPGHGPHSALLELVTSQKLYSWVNLTFIQHRRRR